MQVTCRKRPLFVIMGEVPQNIHEGEHANNPLQQTARQETFTCESLLNDITTYLQQLNNSDFTSRVQLMLFRVCATKCSQHILQLISNISNPSPVQPHYNITKGKVSDFAKILSAMYDIHLFSTNDGRVADSKQELFSYFAVLLGANLDNYSQLLNSAKQGSKDYMKVFDSLRQVANNYYLK